MSRPIKVDTKPVADHYAGPNEKIVEYSTKEAGGGLIAFRITDDGRLVIDLYQHDPQVEIRVGKAREN